MLRRFKKPAIFLLVISLVLGLAAAGFLLIPSRLSPGGLPIQIIVGVPPTPMPTMPTQPQHGSPPVTHGAEGAEGLLYDMGSKVVNLADPGGYRYLKVGIVLEILPNDPEFYAPSGEGREQVEREALASVDKQRPIIEDVVTIKLSGKSFEEVFTIAGKEQLKQELRDELNARLTVGQVREIYFTEFVIQ